MKIRSLFCPHYEHSFVPLAHPIGEFISWARERDGHVALNVRCDQSTNQVRSCISFAKPIARDWLWLENKIEDHFVAFGFNWHVIHDKAPQHTFMVTEKFPLRNICRVAAPGPKVATGIGVAVSAAATWRPQSGVLR